MSLMKLSSIEMKLDAFRLAPVMQCVIDIDVETLMDHVALKGEEETKAVLGAELFALVNTK